MLTPRISAIILTLGLLMCVWPAVTAAEALVLGLAVGMAGLNQWAGMNLAVIWAVGINSLCYTVIGITFTLFFGWWLGRRQGLSRDLTLLISSGTAICGVFRLHKPDQLNS